MTRSDLSIETAPLTPKDIQSLRPRPMWRHLAEYTAAGFGCIAIPTSLVAPAVTFVAWLTVDWGAAMAAGAISVLLMLILTIALLLLGTRDEILRDRKLRREILEEVTTGIKMQCTCQCSAAWRVSAFKEEGAFLLARIGQDELLALHSRDFPHKELPKNAATRLTFAWLPVSQRILSVEFSDAPLPVLSFSQFKLCGPFVTMTGTVLVLSTAAEPSDRFHHQEGRIPEIRRVCADDPDYRVLYALLRDQSP